jgi:hypothetical protein
MRRILLGATVGISLACASANEDPVSRCDAMMGEELKRLYSSSAEAVRLDLEGSRYSWENEPSYFKARELAATTHARELVRLEIGRSPGTPYDSLWYLWDGKRIHEIATGAEGTSILQREVPLADWDRFRIEILSRLRGDVASDVSTSISDSPVYFFCASIDEKFYSFVLEEFPEDSPQFRIVAATIQLSRFKRLPSEFKIFVNQRPAAGLD